MPLPHSAIFSRKADGGSTAGRTVLAVTLALLLVSSLSAARACTVWAAASESLVKGGGTLLVKVRDEKPLPQTYRRINDANGYAFEGLFCGTRQQFNMGVNSQGLAVGRTTAGSVPSRLRRTYRPFVQDGFLGPEYLMRRCASVDEALRQTQVFSGRPVNYILADRTTVAVVEVLPDGTFTVNKTSRGRVTHTNHYIEPASTDANLRIGQSSAARLERIQSLLGAVSTPSALSDFLALSRDRADGPDNSIFRTGSKPDGVRTLAVMGVHIPAAGPAHLVISYQPDPENSAAWVTQSGRVALPLPPKP